MSWIKFPWGEGGKQPTCFDVVLNGAVSGFCIGAAFGSIMGLWRAVLEARAEGFSARRCVRSMGGITAGAGLSFAFFLAVGTAIHCEPVPIAHQSQQTWTSSDWKEQHACKNAQ